MKIVRCSPQESLVPADDGQESNVGESASSGTPGGFDTPTEFCCGGTTTALALDPEISTVKQGDTIEEMIAAPMTSGSKTETESRITFAPIEGLIGCPRTDFGTEIVNLFRSQTRGTLGILQEFHAEEMRQRKTSQRMIESLLTTMVSREEVAHHETRREITESEQRATEREGQTAWRLFLLESKVESLQLSLEDHEQTSTTFDTRLTGMERGRDIQVLELAEVSRRLALHGEVLEDLVRQASESAESLARNHGRLCRRVEEMESNMTACLHRVSGG